MKTMSEKRISPFHITVMSAILLSVLLSLIEAHLILIPAVCILIVSVIAPFCVGTGFFLPIVSKGFRKDNAVALTFDDGPDPSVTPSLLQLLSRHSVRAAFFVVGGKAEMYPEIIMDIISGSHLIASHSYSHDPLLMLRRTSTLKKDIEASVEVLRKCNINPLAFRPPAGITNPRLAKVLSTLGLYCVNFSCRAFDAGNRNITGLSKKILSKVKANDIILLHDVTPVYNNISTWLNEIELLLAGLKDKGMKIVPLDEMIGRPVMELK